MTDVRRWLESLHLEQYADAFEENAIDWSTLFKLDHELLKEIGVKAVGHRVAMLEAIGGLAVAPQVSTDNAAQQASRGGEAELRHLTVMFCDVVGSTALSRRLDPEDYRRVLGAYQSAASKPIQLYDGFIARYMGDGLLVYFGYPSAHEDDAERAVRAGLGIVDVMRALSSDIGVGLEVRIGIATGVVVAGDIVGEGTSEERAVLGETPNLAARLQEASPANGLLISDSTRHLVEKRFHLAPVDLGLLKGLGGPTVAYRVIGVKDVTRFESATADGLTPLFGRDEELEMLLRRWRLAEAGEGQVVLLGGEPGIGKSRLAEALRERVGARDQTLYRFQCSPYHVNSAFHPIVAWIERAAGFDRSDSDDVKLEKLETFFEGGQDEQALIAALLSLPTGKYNAAELTPQKRKSETIFLLAKRLEKASRVSPLLLVLEDAHWIDHSTREFFDVVTQMAERMRVLVLVTHRPYFDSQWTSKGHVTQLILNRLSHGDLRSLVRSVAGEAALPEAILRRILEKTDGVPLFAEELTKTVIEAGVAHGASRGGPNLEFAIPQTIQDSLVARLDRLEMAKQTAQIGATIGREFPFRLIAAVAGDTETAVLDDLERLVDSGLLLQNGIPPDASYTFKHALVRDAAYTTMLKERRRELHRRVADALQRHQLGIAQTQPELLAHHLTEAGEINSALGHWLAAGRLAFSRSAAQEAQAHLEKGLSLIGADSDNVDEARRELEFCVALGPVYMTTKGAFAPEVEHVYNKARHLSEKIGDQRMLFKVLWGLWHAKQIGGSLDASTKLAAQCLELSRRLGHEDCELQAHHANWSTQFFRGEFSACLEHADCGWDLYDVDSHADQRFSYGGHDPGACSRYFSGMCHWFLGRPDHSVGCTTQALELARGIDHPFSLVVTLLYSAYVSYFRRDYGDTRALAQEGLDICEQLGFPTWLPGLAQLRDWAMVAEGSDTDALARMNERVSQLRVAGQLLPGNVLFLADACARTGAHVLGMAAVESGLRLAQERGMQWIVAELHRLRAVLMMEDENWDPREVEDVLGLSLKLARRQNALAVELRSATALARLYLAAGDTSKARSLLAPVYDAFGEGLGTKDLVDAGAVLKRIS